MILDFDKAVSVPIGVVFNGFTVDTANLVYLWAQNHFLVSWTERDRGNKMAYNPID